MTPQITCEFVAAGFVRCLVKTNMRFVLARKVYAQDSTPEALQRFRYQRSLGSQLLTPSPNGNRNLSRGHWQPGNFLRAPSLFIGL